MDYGNVTWFKRLAYSRKPDYTIGSSDDPYMLRWWVIPRNPIFNIYLHLFLRSDTDEALHDHPWINFSRLLEGEYTEWTFLGGPEFSRQLDFYRKKIMKAGDWKIRRATTAHRVELHKGPCWSLFITGPKLRVWGFHCPKGWKPWQEFVNQREGGNERGKGCD